MKLKSTPLTRGLSGHLPALSSPLPTTHKCWLGNGQQPGWQEITEYGYLLVNRGLASPATPSYELRSLPAFCIPAGPTRPGATTTNYRSLVASFSPNLFPFPPGLIPRLHFSAPHADVWGQMTTFWPRECLVEVRTCHFQAWPRKASCMSLRIPLPGQQQG